MNLWKIVRAQWDRVAAGALFAVGGLVLILGWVGVADEALTARQIPYILSGGLGGIFLLGLGAVFWLSADLRDEWRKLDIIAREIMGTHATDPTANGPSAEHAPEEQTEVIEYQPPADDRPDVATRAENTFEPGFEPEAPAGTGHGDAARRRPIRAGT